VRETRDRPINKIEVKPEGGTWRKYKTYWERGVHESWNKQQLLPLPKESADLPVFKNIKELHSRLGTNLAAATDILIDETRKISNIYMCSILNW
jgi:hypothetical protein